MNGAQFLKERLFRGMDQQNAAARLKVSQPYLSLIEAGKRPLTEKLTRRAIRVFKLAPTALPIKSVRKESGAKAADMLAAQLGALGYPKFSHLRKTRKINPASLLMTALAEDDLDSRVVEALPWLIFNFSELDWKRVIDSAKLNDAQNRLGFLLSLASDLAKTAKNEQQGTALKELLATLEKSKLVTDDSFHRRALTASEKAWLRKNRPARARHWRILSNLSAHHLIY